MARTSISYLMTSGDLLRWSEVMLNQWGDLDSPADKLNIALNNKIELENIFSLLQNCVIRIIEVKDVTYIHGFDFITERVPNRVIS